MQTTRRRERKERRANQPTRSDISVDSYGRTRFVHHTGFLDANGTLADTGDESCERTDYITAATPPTTTSPGWLNLVAQTASYSGRGTVPTRSPNYDASAATCAGTQPIHVAKQFYSVNPSSSGSGASAVALNASSQPLGSGFRPYVSASMVRTKNWDGQTDFLDRWLTTTSTVDAAGRTTHTYDASGTLAAYFWFDSVYGYPNRATYPLGVGHTDTVLRPQDGQPSSTSDQNGNTTTYCYDTLGRLTKGYLPPLAGGTTPGCGSAVEPSASFAYDIGAYDTGRTTKTPAIVVTSVLQSTSPAVVRLQSASYLDGLGRTRETQAYSPTTGKIVVTATLYDDRGNSITTTDPFAITDNLVNGTATPGDRTSPPSSGSNGFATWPNLPTGITLRTTSTVYDTANRATSVTRKYGTTTLVTATTDYRGKTTISEPQVGSWQATTVDGLGRTTRVDTYNGTTPPAAAGLANPGAVTTYGYAYDQTANGVGGYDKAGWLTTTVSDDAGNQTVATADLAGRAISSTDPNAGTSTFTYDANGNITAATDANGTTVRTKYDVLNRPLHRWTGTSTDWTTAANADRLAEWSYDTVAGGNGMPASETSWQGGQQYTSTVTGYNSRYQTTSSQMTIPSLAAIPDALEGVWKFETVYNEAGQVTMQSFPMASGVNPTFDRIGTHYNGLGQADTVAAVAYNAMTQLWEPVSSDQYVTATRFDDLGRITRRVLSRDGTTGGVASLVRSYDYDTQTGLVNVLKAGWDTTPADNSDVTWFQYDRYTRDAVGNVKVVEDRGVEPAGSGSDTKECFVYDLWNRLVRAHTAPETGDGQELTGCAAAVDTSISQRGVVDTYDRTWSFDDINRITTTVDVKNGGAATNYDYGTGSPKHSVKQVSGQISHSYSYNPAGAMVRRDSPTVDNLTYDAQQRLTSHAGESYVYTTSNQRLLRHTATGSTLYLPGMEVTATGTGTATITSYRTIGTTVVATRTVTGGAVSVAWNCANMQNSTTCQAPAGSGTIPARKRYTPYGDNRNTVTFGNTDHAFLGQPKDSTGLTYLNNRYMDPATGVFLSVDPLVSKTGTAYLYAGGNPTTQSDPSGLVGVSTICTGVDGIGCVNNTTAKGFTAITQTPNGDVISVVEHWQGWKPLDITDEWVKANGNATEKRISAELYDCMGGDSDGECGRLAILLAGGSLAEASAGWSAMCASIDGLCYQVGSAVPKNPVLEVAEYASLLMPFARAGVGFASGVTSAAGASGAEYSVAGLEAGVLGETALDGSITLSSSLSGDALTLTLRHELVHQYVLRGTVSGPLSRAFYGRSAAWTYAEEALAEGVATSSVIQGLTFPVAAGSGYVTMSGVTFDLAVVIGVAIAGKAVT